MAINRFIKSYLSKQTSAAPLALFRVLFGILMSVSLIRFWLKGWIETLYLQPKFHFSFYGFEWVKPLGNYTYLIFLMCCISTILITLGYKYRFAIIVFFISFTYIEFMDKTTYLNHYYFISTLSFLMIFLPANAYFSLDNLKKGQTHLQIPKWTIDSVKLLLALVYFYAGLAKINSDWLLNAMPLKIWLPSKYDLPLIGESLMQQSWFHYAMSWGGMLFDLSIPFLLLNKHTRWLAFVLICFFHVFTSVLFPIGMFPFIMIVSVLIFFSPHFHQNIITKIQQVSAPLNNIKLQSVPYSNTKFKFVIPLIVVFFVFQIVFPFRYLCYPNELFWTEEGYRFSWRVMLMEKLGETTFIIKNAKTGNSFLVKNSDFLTPFQEKQMSTQPDFILEFAHYLGDHFTKQGHQNIQVFAKSYVALNGRISQSFINDTINLLNQKESFKHKTWILPFNDEIKGF